MRSCPLRPRSKTSIHFANRPTPPSARCPTIHLPRGSKKDCEKSSRTGIAFTRIRRRIRPAGLVVRDGSGRVMIASRIAITQKEEGDTREWSETICDPTRGTVTTLNYRASTLNAVVSDGPDAYIASGAEGTGWSREQKGHTTVVFAWWHNVVNGRVNLGPDTFEGIPAYRYRLTRNRDRSIRDVVNADQLFLQLAQTTWKTYPEVEDEIYLTDIQFGEPPEALFDLPPAVHVSVAQH